jgi:hypothetical protein
MDTGLMCCEDRMDTRLIEFLYVRWIPLVSASLNFVFSTAVVVLLYFLGVRYEENRTT